MVVHPTAGGCWFCLTVDDGEWMFDTEFDTYLHKACLVQALALDDREAQIMSYLLEKY